MPEPEDVVVLDGSEEQNGGDVVMTEVAGESQNLDDIEGDTASEDEDEAPPEDPTTSGEDTESDADEEDVDADDVLEELTFTAQKKLTDIAKCVRHFSTRKTQPRLFHARHNTQDTQPDTHISPLHIHTSKCERYHRVWIDWG